MIENERDSNSSSQIPETNQFFFHVDFGSLEFLDSIRFMNSSLETLTNVKFKDVEITKDEFATHSKSDSQNEISLRVQENVY